MIMLGKKKKASMRSRSAILVVHARAQRRENLSKLVFQSHFPLTLRINFPCIRIALADRRHRRQKAARNIANRRPNRNLVRVTFWCEISELKKGDSMRGCVGALYVSAARWCGFISIVVIFYVLLYFQALLEYLLHKKAKNGTRTDENEKHFACLGMCGGFGRGKTRNF